MTEYLRCPFKIYICNQNKCMSWRLDDEQKGYCSIIQGFNSPSTPKIALDSLKNELIKHREKEL